MSGYVVNTDEQQKDMLKTIGVGSVDELFCDIPEAIRLKGKLNIPSGLSEIELVKHIKSISAKNKNLDDYICFLGAGAYDHYIPSIIDQILSRQEFYTAYTPYQPEISQGTLQVIFEYQTMICELTGMEVSNASMYDGASALAEAASMACQASKKREVLVSAAVHPESRKVLKTYARFNGIRVVEVNQKNGVTDMEKLEELISSDTAAVIIQNPNFFGAIEGLEEFSDIAHRNKALLIADVDPISLGLLKPPGQAGADIVVGEGQPLGNPLNYGGPYLGFFAATGTLLRKMPGRIVGQTTDKSGKRGFVLTMQAREQHIRREKASSNICSNHALNALAATIYLTVLGKKGLAEVANLCLQKAHYTYEKLIATGSFKPLFTSPFFKEFAVRSSIPIDTLNRKLLGHGIIGGYPLGGDYPELDDCWLLAVTEKRTGKEIDLLAEKAVGI